ncbi:MAG: Rne/Rng family ribonuclease [Clostridia bacterium]|nr:Rne/Rng family ribonuclease [Clostridia bacterium]
MKKELYFDRHSGLQLSALVEDGKLVELGIENEERKEFVGNIYKGRVVNVIESMNAAFVDCGLERNCFLPLSDDEALDVVSKYATKTEKRRRKKSPPLQLSPGDELIVQAVKNPRGNKGAKLSTKLSFVSKNLIFLPNTDFLGVSRKISEVELRENLLFTADRLRKKGEGLVVRTVAPYAKLSQLKTELAYLRSLYATVLEKYKTLPVGGILHREYDLPARVIRDSFNDEISRVTVGEKGLYEQLVSLSSLRPAFESWNIELYEGQDDMFSKYGIAEQVKQLSGSTVSLPNGGSIVIERTEALTAIDVNTSRYLGDENLEDTVYATNIAAAREIARQMRLRDVGGIVVVDFIDMLDERHRQSVEEELRQCLSHDKVQSNVLPMNEFCLSVFTRKRTTNGVASKLLKPCSHCKLNGHIFSDEFNICLIRAEILKALSDGAQTVVVDMNRGLMEFLFKHKMLENELKRWHGSKVYFVPHRTYHEEQFKLKAYAKGKRATLPEDAQLLVCEE